MFTRIGISFATMMLVGGFTQANVSSSLLVEMTDQQLSETTGQALMSLTYIAPNDIANLESHREGGG